MALLREYESRWAEFPLAPNELENLGSYLAGFLATNDCDHTSKHTKEWLVTFSPGKQEQKLKALRHWGGYCDCEVLNNAAQNGS